MTRTDAASSVDARLAQTSRDQAEASNPELSVWVSANAGTGKTHVLTMRVLRLLLAGTRPEAILCLTYTKAAAAEMSKRVFDELAKWVTAPATALTATLEKLIGRHATAEEYTRARTLFAAAIETPGGLKIQTIHAFAEQILQRFPLEAGVAPGFAILDEEEAKAIRRDAIDATLAVAAQPGAGDLGAALARAVTYVGDERFDEILASALKKRDWLIALETKHGMREADRHLRKHFAVRAKANHAAIEAEMASLLNDRELQRLAGVLSSGSKTDVELAGQIREALTSLSDSGRASALGGYFLKKDGEQRTRLMTKGLKEEHPDLDAKLETVKGRFAKLSAELASLDVIAASLALYRLAGTVMQRYTEAKACRAALDFDDLIAKTASLLRVRDSADWVLYKLDSGLAHILVDESQDTAPSQWRIIEALADEFFAGAGAREDVRTLFAVGDEKQSIYSFQGAEAQEFARMGQSFTAKAKQGGVKWRTVPLNLSFRTVEPVLNAVDAVFADEKRVPGVASAKGHIEHLAKRVGQAGLVEIWPTEEYEAPDHADPWLPLAEGTKPSPVMRLANRIADTIHGWLKNNEILESENRPIRPGDILILVRKRNPFAGPITAALKARNIAVAGSDRSTLIEHIAIQDLMALGDFLTLPEDDLALASVLKSPLFGLDDDDLLVLAPGRKGTLWKALLDNAAVTPAYGAAAGTLKQWRGRADFMPPYEFFAALLDKDGMRAKLLARLGPDAAETIDEFMDLALTYDDSAPPSLSGFLNWLREGKREIKRDLDHGRNEVRVMTVHGAKGLESSIVFLPDTCTTMSAGAQGIRLLTMEGVSPPGTEDPFVWCVKGSSRLAPIADAKAAQEQREAAERNRLLYVAMTRARDRLYIAGFEGKRARPTDCWYNIVTEALEPMLQPAELPGGSKVLRLVSHQTQPPENPRSSAQSSATSLQLPPWAGFAAPREPQLAVPLAPSRLAPYEIDEEGEPSQKPPPKDKLEEPPTLPPVPAAAADQSRFLRGTLTHALLQHLPSIERASWPTAAKTFMAKRGAALSQRTQGSIVRETLAVLNDPVFAPLFGDKSEAEVPIVAEIPRPHGPGPALKLTGQIDRLADTGREVLIVDYKTNRPPPDDPAKVADVYLYQLAAYRLAIAEIFKGKAVRCAILWTETPALMEIPPALLDQFAARLWTLDPTRLDA